jgi:PST family polysaccharide transporter
MEEQSSNQSSYKQIFKSSVLIGGSQVFNIIIGIIKNKVLAVMLGPEGVGLMGVYSAITNVITPIAGIGIGSSGVRQIAEAINEEDESKKSFLIKFIRVSLIVASLIAVFFIVVFHEKIAKISFRKEFKDEYLLGVIVIAGVVLFDTLTTGERAILQGARRLRSLASSQILG